MASFSQQSTRHQAKPPWGTMHLWLKQAHAHVGSDDTLPPLPLGSFATTVHALPSLFIKGSIASAFLASSGELNLTNPKPRKDPSSLLVTQLILQRKQKLPV